MAAIGGPLFGYDTAVIYGALPYVKGDLHAGPLPQEAIVSVLLASAACGAVVFGLSCRPDQRRNTKIISGALYVVARSAYRG